MSDCGGIRCYRCKSRSVNISGIMQYLNADMLFIIHFDKLCIEDVLLMVMMHNI